MIALLTMPIRFYRRFISPYTPAACRFEPTCSAYTLHSMEKHGLWGLWLGLWRIARCQPFTAGGLDPVLPEGS